MDFYDESRRRKMEKGIVRLLDTKDNTKRFDRPIKNSILQKSQWSSYYWRIILGQFLLNFPSSWKKTILRTRITDANPQENSRRRHRDEERRPFVNPLGLREVSSDGLFRGAEVRGKV